MSRRHMRAMTGTLVALCLSFGFVGCSAGSSTSGSGAARTGLPASADPALDAGRQLIESKCAMCHTLDRVKTANHDAAAWEQTITRMRSHGLVITDQEMQQILDYLKSR